MSRYLIQNSPERIEELKEFLYNAKIKTRGTNNPAFNSPEGVHRTVYENNGWRFVDEWYGVTPFSGFTKISYYGDICWTMHYWGDFTPGIAYDSVYEFLLDVLSNPAPSAPWRGSEVVPSEHGDRYFNEIHGDIVSFGGHETIRNVNGLLL